MFPPYFKGLLLCKLPYKNSVRSGVRLLVSSTVFGTYWMLNNCARMDEWMNEWYSTKFLTITHILSLHSGISTEEDEVEDYCMNEVLNMGKDGEMSPRQVSGRCKVHLPEFPNLRASHISMAESEKTPDAVQVPWHPEMDIWTTGVILIFSIKLYWSGF